MTVRSGHGCNSEVIMQYREDATRNLLHILELLTTILKKIVEHFLAVSKTVFR